MVIQTAGVFFGEDHLHFEDQWLCATAIWHLMGKPLVLEFLCGAHLRAFLWDLTFEDILWVCPKITTLNMWRHIISFLFEYSTSSPHLLFNPLEKRCFSTKMFVDVPSRMNPGEILILLSYSCIAFWYIPHPSRHWPTKNLWRFWSMKTPPGR